MELWVNRSKFFNVFHTLGVSSHAAVKIILGLSNDLAVIEHVNFQTL